jgi:peptidoglycan/LPS O-acetylase OafA/YrhL
MMLSGALALVVVAFVALGVTARISAIGTAVSDTFVGAMTAAAMVGMSLDTDGSVRAFFSTPALVRIGGFSYSLYLIHAPLLQIAWKYVVHPMGFGETTTFLLLVLVGMPLAVGGAYLFFLAFERPFTTAASRARARRMDPASAR